MACERYREAIADVAAGEPALGALEAHLASCQACRAELHTLRQALALADVEMAGLSSAEPSPVLLARIRQVAAHEPNPAPWRFGWAWPAAAAAAVATVALVTWPGRATAPVLPRDPREARAIVLPRAPGASTPEGSAGPPAVAAARANSPSPARKGAPRHGATASGRASWRDEPEVMLPPGEAEAFLRFAAHLQTRTVSPDSLLVADLSGPLPEPKGVEIRPLEIVPLDPAEASGTD